MVRPANSSIRSNPSIAAPQSRRDNALRSTRNASSSARVSSQVIIGSLCLAGGIACVAFSAPTTLAVAASAMTPATGSSAAALIHGVALPTISQSIPSLSLTVGGSALSLAGLRRLNSFFTRAPSTNGRSVRVFRRVVTPQPASGSRTKSAAIQMTQRTRTSVQGPARGSDSTSSSLSPASSSMLGAPANITPPPVPESQGSHTQRLDSGVLDRRPAELRRLDTDLNESPFRTETREVAGRTLRGRKGQQNKTSNLSGRANKAKKSIKKKK